MPPRLVIVQIVLACVCFFYCTIFVLFLLTISRTLRQVRLELRRIPPATIWICWIPIVGFAFAFLMVPSVSISLRRQFKELDAVDRKSSYGLVSGLSCLLMFVGAYLVSSIGTEFEFWEITDVIGKVFLFVSFIFWIVYWVQISKFGRQLRTLKRVDYTPEELDFDDDLGQNREDR